MANRERKFQVEALTYSDTFDALVDLHFRGRSIHRAEDTGAYDVTKIVEKFDDKLSRSRQEYLPAPSGFSTQLEWASLCFQFESDVFVTIMARGNSALRSRTGEDEYKVTVTAGSHQKAASVLSDLRQEFLERSDTPAFFIMTGGAPGATCTTGKQPSTRSMSSCVALR